MSQKTKKMISIFIIGAMVVSSFISVVVAAVSFY